MGDPVGLFRVLNVKSSLYFFLAILKEQSDGSSILVRKMEKWGRGEFGGCSGIEF